MRAPDYEQYTDNYLLQQLSHNDQAAFTVIYQRYWKTMFREAMNVLRSVKGACYKRIRTLFASLFP